MTLLISGGFDDSDYEQTIKWLQQRRVRKIDLGCIRYQNKKGGKLSPLFSQLRECRSDSCYHESASQDSSCIWFPHPVVPLLIRADDFPAIRL